MRLSKACWKIACAATLRTMIVHAAARHDTIRRTGFHIGKTGPWVSYRSLLVHAMFHSNTDIARLLLQNAAFQTLPLIISHLSVISEMLKPANGNQEHILGGVDLFKTQWPKRSRHGTATSGYKADINLEPPTPLYYLFPQIS